MTEDKAKTKWCPFSIVVIDAQNYASGNRFDNGDFDKKALCKASGCMLWQWDKDMVSIGLFKTSKTEGYCGNTK